MPIDKLDSFTRAYIETALWSSTGEPFGECAACGSADKVLYFDPETREHALCYDCRSADYDSPWEPSLDDNYDIGDIAPEALSRMIADCSKFQTDCIDDIAWDNLVRFPHGESTHAHAGHDFWLTRNGHGAGFWDGDWIKEVGARLTKVAISFGECGLYVGDDGKLYLN